MEFRILGKCARSVLSPFPWPSRPFPSLALLFSPLHSNSHPPLPSHFPTFFIFFRSLVLFSSALFTSSSSPIFFIFTCLPIALSLIPVHLLAPPSPLAVSSILTICFSSSFFHPFPSPSPSKIFPLSPLTSTSVLLFPPPPCSVTSRPFLAQSYNPHLPSLHNSYSLSPTSHQVETHQKENR